MTSSVSHRRAAGVLPIRPCAPTLVRRFAASERGAIALMFALMLPVLFGIVGLGVEAGIWFKERRQLQTITDAATVAAAIEHAYGATSAEVLAAATLEATANGFDATRDSIVYYGAPQSGPHTGDADYMEVRITRQLDTILSQVFYTLDPQTTARAVASTYGDQDACVLALSSSAMNSIYLNGAGTSVNMVGCGLVANSTHATKSVNVQNGSLSADCISAAGGIGGQANISTACSNMTENGNAIDDPMASLDVPSEASLTLRQDPPGNNPYQPATGATLQPGIYKGGIKFNAGTNVTLASGTYVMDAGDFTVNGGAAISGNNVVIILTNYGGGSAGKISINGGGTVDLYAPTSGAYNGVLFYQDRNCGSSSSQNTNINGGASVTLTGMIYTPNTSVSYSGNSTLSNTGCLMLVAQTISFNGNATLANQCNMFGGNPVVYGAAPGLIE